MSSKTDMENLQRAALLYSKARSREHNSFMEYTRQHNVDYQKAEKARKRAGLYAGLAMDLMNYIIHYGDTRTDELYGEAGCYRHNPPSDGMLFVPERLIKAYGIDWQGVYMWHGWYEKKLPATTYTRYENVYEYIQSHQTKA